MNIADKVKMEFEDAIRSAIKDWQRDADEPANLFSRNRKLDQVTMIKLLCLMGGNKQFTQGTVRLPQPKSVCVQLL